MISELTLAEALDRASLFATLTVDEKAGLETVAKLRQCQKGEQIIAQGQPLRSMYIILEGGAEVKINGESVATIPAQCLVGETEFLDSLPGSADVTLLEATPLIELRHAALTELMEQQPRLGYVLMCEIARIEGRRLRAMDER